MTIITESISPVKLNSTGLFQQAVLGAQPSCSLSSIFELGLHMRLLDLKGLNGFGSNKDPLRPYTVPMTPPMLTFPPLFIELPAR